jgi:hypothetical protein
LEGLKLEAAAAQGKTPDLSTGKAKGFPSVKNKVTKKVKIPESGVW